MHRGQSSNYQSDQSISASLQIIIVNSKKITSMIFNSEREGFNYPSHCAKVSIYKDLIQFITKQDAIGNMRKNSDHFVTSDSCDYYNNSNDDAGDVCKTLSSATSDNCVVGHQVAQ